MFDLDRWQEIWITITRNKMRSILTAFGVFWGIFMLVVMSGAGFGLENGVNSEVEGFAQNSAYFFGDLTSEPYKGFRKGRSWHMRNEDMGILTANIPEIRYISPVLFGGKGDNNTAYGDKYGSYNIKGFNPMYNFIEPQEMVYGRYLNEVDINDRRKVCIIGKKVYDEMFQPGENPLGKLLKINGIYYQVIGVNEPTTQVNVGGNARESIILPYTVMQQTYNRGDALDCIAVTAEDQIRIGDLEEKITSLLKAKHSIAPTDQRAIQSVNVEKQFRMFNMLFLGIRSLIWIVGLGTLLAGVVGVSNIMLVTVRERTKEIGIRRALGAKPAAILVQIMNESLVLTAIAGFFGLALGVGLLSIVDNAMTIAAGGEPTFFKHPQLPFNTAIMASVVLLISGMMAGIIPAWRALQIKAIDALRDE